MPIKWQSLFLIQGVITYLKLAVTVLNSQRILANMSSAVVSAIECAGNYLIEAANVVSGAVRRMLSHGMVVRLYSFLYTQGCVCSEAC